MGWADPPTFGVVLVPWESQGRASPLPLPVVPCGGLRVLRTKATEAGWALQPALLAWRAVGFVFHQAWRIYCKKVAPGKKEG